ncbi:hypothetical protein FB45DRAFT_899267 [Roridomyces roridus]|uniref:Uncharacterized protein n=1 Tax=Roridomyces roridus TaxID=1738132 RepID=A0AAD7C721_9AGAR|nr:hypothetical protein FB45DRAFT_899267 [Roridomyces roridus]
MAYEAPVEAGLPSDNPLVDIGHGYDEEAAILAEMGALKARVAAHCATVAMNNSTLTRTTVFLQDVVQHLPTSPMEVPAARSSIAVRLVPNAFRAQRGGAGGKTMATATPSRAPLLSLDPWQDAEPVSPAAMGQRNLKRAREPDGYDNGSVGGTPSSTRSVRQCVRVAEVPGSPTFGRVPLPMTPSPAPQPMQPHSIWPPPPLPTTPGSYTLPPGYTISHSPVAYPYPNPTPALYPTQTPPPNWVFGHPFPPPAPGNGWPMQQAPPGTPSPQRPNRVEAYLQAQAMRAVGLYPTSPSTPVRPPPSSAPVTPSPGTSPSSSPSRDVGMVYLASVFPQRHRTPRHRQGMGRDLVIPGCGRGRGQPQSPSVRGRGRGG